MKIGELEASILVSNRPFLAQKTRFRSASLAFKSALFDANVRFRNSSLIFKSAVFGEKMRYRT